MDSRKTWEPALEPEDLARFFVVRANAGDVDGLVALYETDAVLAGSADNPVAYRVYQRVGFHPVAMEGAVS